MLSKWLKRIAPVLFVLALIVPMVATLLPASIVKAVPRTLYWVGDSGNWSSSDHWSLGSGGASGEVKPDTDDSVIFDAASFTIPAQVVTVDEASACLDMTWTGATNEPTLTLGIFSFTASGDVTFISAMTITNSGYGITFIGTSDLTMNGKRLKYINVGGGGVTPGTVNFLDAVSVGQLQVSIGVLTTNNNVISIDEASFNITTAGAKTITLGTSTITTPKFDYSGSNLTLTANTSTINVIGTGAFNGGNITTYNNINLNGSAHTVSGSFTCAKLALPPGTTQTISFTDGTTQTATTLTLGGSAGHVHTLTGTGAAGWNLSVGAGTVSADYIDIDHSTAAGGATFNAVGTSLDGGDNVGWNFLLTATTQAETGVTMNKDGVTGGTFNGTLVDMGGNASVDVNFEYGLTAAYGSETVAVAKTVPGAYTAAIPNNLTPGATYHYRSKVTDGVDTAYGADETFVFTMPSVATAAATISGANITLHGNVTNMGVATSLYVRFQWGYTPAANTYTTAAQTKTDATAFSQTIAADPSQRVYYRAMMTVGVANGLTNITSFYATNSAAQTQGIANLFPLIFLAAAIAMFGVAMTTESFTIGGLVLAVIFLIFSVTGVQTIIAALAGLWGG